MKRYIPFLVLFFCCAVSHADVIRTRQAFFREMRKNPVKAQDYLQDRDPEIRRYALFLVMEQDPLKHFSVIARTVSDPDEQVRLTAVAALSRLTEKDPRVLPLLRKIARTDPSRQVREIAVKSTWPFHREIKLLRDDPTWDYEVKTVKRIPLQELPWKFTTDPMQEGHLKRFFDPDFDTSGWKNIKMGVWENQGIGDYDGIAWYQIKFTMPPKMDCNAVEIVFDGVDESAWVWLNGVYLGSHDVGPEGWKEPFAVDCRSEIRWGKENILTIRVNDTAFAGGIYKPVRIEVLK